MRNPHTSFRLLFCLGLIGIVVSGCKTQHVAYHSMADLPYFTEATTTQMELVVGDEEAADSRDYVVFAAVDNQSTGYVLLAPYTGNSSSSGYSLDNANLARAVPLQGENLNVLVDGVQRAAEFWTQEEVDGEGTFVEFIHAAEQDIRQVSENVVEWRPAIRFTFSHTSDGPSARMLLGDAPEERLQYGITFDGREEVVDFRDVLEAARERVQRLVSR